MKKLIGISIGGVVLYYFPVQVLSISFILVLFGLLAFMTSVNRMPDGD